MRSDISVVSVPAVDNDFIPSAPSTLVKTGQFAKNISVILGWNTNDGSIFTPPSISNDSDVASFMTSNPPFLSNATINHFLTLYPAVDFEHEVIPNDTVNVHWYRASRIFRDIEFVCPSVDLGYNVMKYNKHVDAWLYQLDQTPYAALSDASSIAYLGVAHTSDIFYVFNEVHILNDTLKPSVADEALAKTMSGMWASYAVTGDPTSGSGGNATAWGGYGSWPAAFSPSDIKTNPEGATKARVNVLGGAHPGPKGIRVNGRDAPVGMEKLLERCEFINSIYDELKT